MSEKSLVHMPHHMTVEYHVPEQTVTRASCGGYCHVLKSATFLGSVVSGPVMFWKMSVRELLILTVIMSLPGTMDPSSSECMGILMGKM